MDLIIEVFNSIWKLIKSISPTYLSFFAAFASAITAFLTYKSNKKKDEVFLVPKLFLHKFNQYYSYPSQYNRHSSFTIKDFKSNKLHLTLTNISKSKIFDLNISVKLEVSNKTKKLINYIWNNKLNSFFINQDENGEPYYFFNHTLGVSYEEKIHKNILFSEEEITLTLPNALWMIIDGYNVYMYEFICKLDSTLAEKELIKAIEHTSSQSFDVMLNISYTHSLTKKTIIIERKLPINLKFVYHNGKTNISWEALQLTQK
ncbi:hypothetical protein [Staphylococcus hominis]|uniref:hypothetical protein n=1 Tax=Staphylococcus hominis TaxID=1290 RepID=UPI0018899BC2|nr:hypothetical protein [Staphylococcus hominis]MBF2307730.1 hypothetical protein [Staphylococcus hominis]MBF2316742.1 hypothetical protein [Staphylococcus hominis]MBF2321028.1 hypothetical protein [Staphylococcus hominis]